MVMKLYLLLTNLLLMYSNSNGGIIKVSNRIRSVSAAILSIYTLNSFPMKAHSVSLGDHTSCAYPACTSQLEVLLSNSISNSFHMFPTLSHK